MADLRRIAESEAQLESRARDCPRCAAEEAERSGSNTTSQVSRVTPRVDDITAESLARILEAHPEPVLTVWTSGHPRYANKRARGLAHSITKGDVLVPSLLELVTRAAAGSLPLQEECALAERTFAVLASPGAGEVTLYLHDITAQRLVEAFSDALNDIHQLVHSSRDFQAIMQGAMCQACAALHAETAALSLRQKHGWILSFVHGLASETIGSEMSDADELHALRAISECVPVAIDDAWNDERVNQAHMRKWGIRAVLVVPLLVRGEPLGVVFFNYHAGPQKFGDPHRDFATKLASAMSLAIENARLFKELEEREHGLRQADRRKDEFLATLSHELRNPLAPIKNSLFVVQRAASGSEQSQRAITVIDRQVALLANLVDDLLDVSRVANGKLSLHRRRLELNDLVHRTVEDAQSLFDKAGVQLHLRLAPSLLQVKADATRLGQVLTNLLQNAAKFTPFGGHTWVSVEAGADSVVIRVRDSGVGIESDTLERLFEAFMQAPQQLEKSKGGLGLGLALAKGLIELHDGTISATSEGLGRGSTFTVVLPLDCGERCSSFPPVAYAEATTSRRILIIEDDVDAADTLRDVLEFGHHVVDVAYGGREGLVRAKSFDPHVILCDIGLPDMDGYEVARRLRRESSSSACLIALTGHALPADVARARQAGFDCHLAKPLAPDELEKTLAQLARR